MKNWRSIIITLIAVALFLIPNLFWGHLYIVGGDDSRLYYIYPFEYLRNFSFNIISSNTLGGNLGYFPVSYPAPTVLVLLLVKQLLPAFNTQFFVYGIIFSLGFLFFYNFLRELKPQKTPFSFWSRVVTSLFYILSPYVTHTFFQHQLISIFLLLVVPGCLYLFTTGVKRKNIAYVVAASLLYCVFSSTVFSLPWLLPVLITFVPLFVWFVRSNGTYFWKALFVFICVTLLSNMYWIIHYIIPVVYKTGDAGVTSNLMSEMLKSQNSDLIFALTYLNSPVSQVINFLRTGWGERQGITLVESLGGIYLLVILAAGIFLRRAGKEIRVLYVVSVCGLLLAMLFVTPNFGLWNLQLFLWLNEHLPFFGMLRNMYDKFALAMAVNYALALFVSFVVLGKARVKYLLRYVALLVILAFTIGNAVPYIRPVYHDEGYSTRISGQMNKDFYDLTAYLKTMNTTSRFLWYPMTFPGYVYIADESNPNHFYAGLSPLQLFSQKNDIAGFYGIQTPGQPDLNWRILDLLKTQSFEKVGHLLAGQNIGYVIMNHDVVPAAVFNSFNNFDFINYQNDTYKGEILGQKIRDFGSRYSLYTLNRKLAVPTVYLTRQSGSTPTVDKKVSFHKMPNGEYDITMEGITESMSLIFLEPFNRLWRIRVVSGHPVLSSHPTLAYGYGNAWTITPSTPSEPIHIQIYFWPNKFIVPSIVISAVSAFAAALICLVGFLRKKQKA